MKCAGWIIDWLPADGAQVPRVWTCEEIEQLTPRREDAKACKEEQLCFLCAFKTFAPLREMLFLFGRFFHTSKSSGCLRRPSNGIMFACLS